ncbi:response regulator [Chloroflexota bacterium]
MKNSTVCVMKILVVEDEPAISEFCRRVLTSAGFEVEIAVNGKVAQEMIEKRQYGLCLFDIKTPRMNGKELYQWLKEKHPQQASKVIFTTGSVMGGDTMTFIEQSGNPLLPKPFTPAELEAIVRETLMQIGK